MKNIDDIMKELTWLKNISNGHDVFDAQLNAIADTLEVFNVNWQFVEENGKFIAKIK